MPSENAPRAKLTTIASFPTLYFLESMAVRADTSILVTVANRSELWYVPPGDPNGQVDAVLLSTFAQSAMGIAEVAPEIFYIATSPVIEYQAAILSRQSFTSHDSYLHRLDMRGWAPGGPVKPETVLQFPEPARGLQYAANASYLYYTNTAKELVMRVRVDPGTNDPACEPEFVAGGMMGDDFCLDEDAGAAYIATHRQNTIDRVSLEPAENSYVRHSVAGRPFTLQLIGPTNGKWGRSPGDHGRIAYHLTDGGTKAPPIAAGGTARPATVVRVEL